MGLPRPTNWDALYLGGDPTPGDPGMITTYATNFDDAAGNINRALTNLRSALEDPSLESDFVEAVRVRSDEVAEKLLMVRTRFRGGADALLAYAPTLDTAQDMADRALYNARLALDAIDTAVGLIYHYEKELRDPTLDPSEQARYRRLLNSAEADRDEGYTSHNTALNLLQAAITMRNTAADTAVEALAAVQAESGMNDTVWDNWVQFWEENGELIDLLITIASIVAAVVVVVLICTGVGAAIIGLIGAIIAVVTIVNALAQFGAGTKTAGEAIMDIALALLPVGAGAIAKTALGGIIKTGAAAVMASKTAQGISGWTSRFALNAVEGVAMEAAPSLLQRLLTSSADELAQFQAIGAAQLTLNGSDNVAALASQTWKFFLDVPPVAAPVVESLDFLDDILGTPADVIGGILDTVPALGDAWDYAVPNNS